MGRGKIDVSAPNTSSLLLGSLCTQAPAAAHIGSARNCHFQEHLQDGGVRFDYRLRPGPATTRTALRILEQEGYPKALLERARGLMPPEHRGE